MLVSCFITTKPPVHKATFICKSICPSASVPGRHVEKYVVPEDDSYMTNPNLTISVPIAPGESDVEFPEEEEDEEEEDEEQSEGSEVEEEEREEVGRRSDGLLIRLSLAF